jgi:hypothetical protein
MDRVFSTRLSEKVLGDLERITRRLGLTKKEFLEEAIRQHAAQLETDAQGDVWSETLGAWTREESPEESVAKSRQEFERSFARRRSRPDARVRR